MAERLMARRPMAKPGETTPVVTPEEQAKIDDAAAEVAKAAEAEVAEKAAEAEKAKADAAKAAATAAPAAAAPAKPAQAAKPKEPKHRFEEFDATKPDGTVVHIHRNIDTGEQEVTEK
ncbi:hypothetical protein [Microbacterium sp. MYb72]|uniref:hypothetical protein n=1 Tax=Microbacterium sp. MYb72 TaxID=1848693 RepID=UPI0011B06E22|nr:hypothetical protein [Microbacterium sp. MYb72]